MIAIVGAGGVGSLLAGMLARAGEEVTVVARGKQLEALRRDGLRVEAGIGTFNVPMRVAEKPPPADVTFVAVKAWQVSEVAAGLQGVVVPLQNGLEAHDRLAAVLGPERVLGGLCHMFAWLEKPGLVKHSGAPPSVTVGEWTGGGSPRCDALVATLQRAGITAQVAQSVQAAVWEKALFVEALGAVGAAMRLPVGGWRAVPESRALLIEAMRETERVARAAGVELGEAVQRALARIDALLPEATASMHRDLVAGRPSELDDQTGAIVRVAAARGVEVPLHRFLLGVLLPHERKARAT